MAQPETPSEEHHRHMADLHDEAAAAYETELSSTDDARRRHELGEQIRREREAATFYREQADKLQGES